MFSNGNFLKIVVVYKLLYTTHGGQRSTKPIRGFFLGSTRDKDSHNTIGHSWNQPKKNKSGVTDCQQGSINCPSLVRVLISTIQQTTQVQDDKIHTEQVQDLPKANIPHNIIIYIVSKVPTRDMPNNRSHRTQGNPKL